MKIRVLKNYGLPQGCISILKTPQDPPFEVADEKGRELVERGIAVIEEETPSEKNDGDTSAPADLTKMKVEELKALANEQGIEGSDNMKKTELLEVLSARKREGEALE